MLNELSLHVLDLARNALDAAARRIDIEIDETEGLSRMRMRIADDGVGMEKALLERVTDPFVTTSTTRPVGMGIPLAKMAAEATGGTFDVRSRSGEGTEVLATFNRTHIDCVPVGDMAATVATLVQGARHTEIRYVRRTHRGQFTFDTARLREELGDCSLQIPDVLKWIRKYVTSGEASVMANNS